MRRFRQAWPATEIPLLALTMVVLAAMLTLLPLKLGLFLLAGIAFTLALLLHPILGLYALALVIPFSAAARVPLGPASIGPTDILVGAACFAWFLRVTALGEERRPAPLLWLLLPFAIALLYSTLAARSLVAALPELVKWAEVIVVYWLGAQLLTPKHRLPLLLTLLAAGSVEALIGIRQFIFQIGPEAYLLGRFLRAYGTFGQPNPYAGYLGLLLPLGMSLSLWALVAVFRDQYPVFPIPWMRSRGWARGWLLLVIAGMTGVIGLGIVVSWSRGAWLGAMASTATVLALSSVWGLGLMLALVAGLVVAWPALPSSITARLADVARYFGTWNVRGVPVTDANFSILERVAHWQAAWEMFADHFWLGIGVGNWDVVYPNYAIGIWKASLGHAHNVLFHYAAVAGVFGATSYLWLWLGSLWRAFWASLRRSGLEKAMAVGVTGMLVHLSIHNQFDNLWVQGMPLVIALGLALLPLASRQDDMAPPDQMPVDDLQKL
ncbi:MAG TPA: hypothetical protein EYP25_05000 [Anaerolineae bacterium]|nr:hypothetical protein [Anaerolineae bacterium]